MFEICREMLKEKDHAKWASHVSYSNDVLLVDEKVPSPSCAPWRVPPQLAAVPCHP